MYFNILVNYIIFNKKLIANKYKIKKYVILIKNEYC